MQQIMLMALLLAVVAFGGCNRLTGRSTEGSSSSNPASPGAVGAGTAVTSGNPKEDLIKWMGGQLNARSFRAHSTSTTANGNSTRDIEDR
jgi:hypothetical protein